MNGQPEAGLDTGTAYGMKPASYDENLVEVGPGTPMGELMRRYWQPFFASEELTSDRPQRVRLLGENLILFRDKQGTPGLVFEHCCHRGSSLYYGRVEDDGIRCCYHGWKFDAKGHCLDQPAEVGGGKRREHVRQPWYPVQERYGLIYAYMGPPEKKPVLPRWQHLEDLKPDELIEVRWRPSAGELNTDPGAYLMNPLPYNWLQIFENTTDAAHLPWLHYHHSGDQFSGISDLQLSDKPAELPPYAVIEDLAGRVVIERTALGLKQGFPIRNPNGDLVLLSNETMVPNVTVLTGVTDLYYIVPVDDTHFIMFMLWRSEFKGEHGAIDSLHGGKTWWEMTPEDRQRYPGDYEAQSSIGALPAHNRENLAQSDVALSMLRRILRGAVKDVAEGRDPPNVSFDPEAPPLKITDLQIAPVA